MHCQFVLQRSNVRIACAETEKSDFEELKLSFLKQIFLMFTIQIGHENKKIPMKIKRSTTTTTTTTTDLCAFLQQLAASIVYQTGDFEIEPYELSANTPWHRPFEFRRFAPSSPKTNK
jgi:hypothetical protein